VGSDPHLRFRIPGLSTYLATTLSSPRCTGFIPNLRAVCKVGTDRHF
jgi:hypothetical protein